MPPPEPMMRALRDFLTASSWDGSRTILNDHPEILNFGPEVIDIIAHQDPNLFYPGRSRSEAVALLKAHRAVLVRCKEAGIPRAIEEVKARERAARQTPERERAIPRRREEENRKPDSHRRAWLITAAAMLAIAAGITTFFLVNRTGEDIPAGPGIAFSPDGKMLASAEVNGTVYLWNTASRQVAATLIGTQPEVASVPAFSPDGKTLGAIYGNDSLRLWDVADRRVVATLTDPNSQGVTGFAFSPDGRTLATFDSSNDSYLWTITGRRITAALRVLPPKSSDYGVISGAAFSPDGRMLAMSLTGNGLYPKRPGAEIWDVAARRIAATLPPDMGGGEIAYSPNGRTLAISDGGGTAYLWDTATKTTTLTLRAPASTGVCYGGDALAFSPDGKMLATADGCANNSAFLWKTATGHQVAALTGPSALAVGNLAFSPGGKALATASASRTVYLWNIATGQVTATLTDPSP